MQTCVPGMNLADLMQGSGLVPTQLDIHAGSVNDYAEMMRSGAWDWSRTATDLLAPMVLDSENRILAGHHRFVAAWMAGVTIPEGVVKQLGRPSAGRPAYSWSEVQAPPGVRPPRPGWFLGEGRNEF